MEDLVPSEFYLSQNYPNPFTEKTTIKYCVPDKTLIKLTVYNSDMKIIDELENKIKEAGTYEIEFYASNLKQGAYFYNIQAGEFTQSKKMLLIK